MNLVIFLRGDEAFSSNLGYLNISRSNSKIAAQVPSLQATHAAYTSQILHFWLAAANPQ